jgi:CDGSH-type Zn-finger protein
MAAPHLQKQRRFCECTAQPGHQAFCQGKHHRIGHQRKGEQTYQRFHPVTGKKEQGTEFTRDRKQFY